MRCFAAGAEGPHPHVEDRPTGERGHLAGAAAFEFKQREDETLIGFKLIEDAIQQRGRGGLANTFITVIEQGPGLREPCLFRLAEIGGAKFGAMGFVAMPVAAHVERDARDPVLQRSAEIKAAEMVEDADERFLHEIFDGIALGKMDAHNGGHARMQA